MAHCPLCGTSYDPRLLALGHEAQPAVVRLIQSYHAVWNPAQGVCPRCLLRFVALLQSQRSPHSLQASTTPPTTFPYYHPAEETVLPQAIRLPHYEGLDGHGITVGFLDSGYYPHPDLTSLAQWPDAPPLSQLNSDELRAVIAAQPLRLAHYVDLTNHQQVEGLETNSLWDGAGDSWHGEMTSTLALGNGLLSDGLLHGYAPGASGLLIKMGRGGGRISEEDILRGLTWFLEGDRWEQYGVRVLNVSVGGDFDERWHDNAVCLAVEELSRRGVFIAAAAGNSSRNLLLAPAQAPSVLTVGGVDDFNRRWSPLELDEIARLQLYSHNWAEVRTDEGMLRKPEVLALARWLPAPILPPSPLLAEMVAIGELRARLQAIEEKAEVAPSALRAFLPRLLGYRKRRAAKQASVQRAKLWHNLRQRMNAHKWIHPYYQHVDGTSVSVAQVSALAAQMIQGNPALTPAQVKQLILSTALPLPHLPAERSGAGIIQPTRAVAAALRAEGGPLVGLPMSGSQLEIWPAAPHHGEGAAQVYVGLWAPHARVVSVVGDFNGWQPGLFALTSIRDGWWHGTLGLTPGRHHYRFWLEEQAKEQTKAQAGGQSATSAKWLPDPENPARSESGYRMDHSLLIVAA